MDHQRTVHLNAGDVVCIRGQVRVPSPISGSVDGLMILDSLGGDALAERIDQTNGWREFVLYRAAPHAGDLTLTFALTGLGEAWVDDVSIRLIPHGTRSFIPSDGFSSSAMRSPNRGGHVNATRRKLPAQKHQT